jgi:16S rRNA G1207 methylase RsmC
MLSIERDGFFQTPPEVVRQMMDKATLMFGDRVLEPSAGLGAILHPFACTWGEPLYIVAVEKNSVRCEKLSEQFPGVEVHCADFLTWKHSHNFTKILMNPPFEEGQDIRHIEHAYEFLAPEGTLVCIMGEGAFFREDRLAKRFRNWMDYVEGVSYKLPEGSFKSSGTDVNARIVVVHK